MVSGTRNQAYQMGYLFAQGVVMLAFEDLMPLQQGMTMAKRAVTWADATVDVEQFRK
jgi:hypothetical protein